MRSLGLTVVFAALAAFAPVNAALADDGLDFHRALMSRQAPGTPAYDCHFNCGNTISGGRMANHCDNSTWIGLYEACLDCALDFDIWQYYGNGVTNAARACGLSPTPSPSGDSASSPSSTAAASSASASASGGVSSQSSTARTSVSVSVSVSESGGAGASSTSAATAPGSSSAAVASNATFSLTTTAFPSGTAATQSGASPTSSVTTGGAPGREIHAVVYMLGISTLVAAMSAGLIGPW
ncbi:hypothetical protein C8A03DRAFT_32566 [Achaetomium macrosporum]|uniref:Uncharacterized protein n=1 Tax=Achaetomium macrosporum TaxID=79813 RepID=A0AAN7CCA3_9PEZI|nr:hypothetical protein C8A03DRAFT_32566 [Achaetomium macrosporum]